MLPLITIETIVYHATNKGQTPATIQQIMDKGWELSGNYIPPDIFKDLRGEEGYQRLLNKSINLGRTVTTPDGTYTLTQKVIDGFKSME